MADFSPSFRKAIPHRECFDLRIFLIFWDLSLSEAHPRARAKERTSTGVGDRLRAEVGPGAGAAGNRAGGVVPEADIGDGARAATGSAGRGGRARRRGRGCLQRASHRAKGPASGSGL